MSEYITHSRAETVALGARMAGSCWHRVRWLRSPAGWARARPLLPRALPQGLGCTDPVSSPTFAIVNYYRGPRAAGAL